MLDFIKRFFHRRECEKHVNNIEEFQLDNDIPASGKMDESTIRRVELEQEFKREMIPTSEKPTSRLFFDGSAVNIDWDKVVTYVDDETWGLPKKCFRKREGGKPGKFICHWDVCLNSRQCFNILKKRGLSTQFLIDNDGTIIQTMDAYNIAFHAGVRSVNNQSIGVEISNAYYPKYQKYYTKKNLGLRPILKDVQVHGRTLDPFMGFYPVQIEALKALINTVTGVCGIPLQTATEYEEMVTTVSDTALGNAEFYGSNKGVFHHFHVKRNKIDCAGLDLVTLLGDVQQKRTDDRKKF